MKHFNLIVIVTSCLISSTIVGCSSAPRVAEDDFKYVDTTIEQPLAVDANLGQPKHNDEFDIPNAKVEGKVGNTVSVLPPRLLLPITPGSSVDEARPDTTLWFEQTEEIENLEATIWLAISDYYQENGLKLIKADRQQGYIETQWVPHFVESGWWLWTSNRKIESRRFSFQIKMKPHGRTGSVTISLIERRKEGLNQLVSLDKDEEIGIGTDMLNSVVGHFDYSLRLAAEKRRVEYSKGVEVKKTLNERDEHIFIANTKFAHTWLRTLDALNELKVLITDLNKIEGRIYARINEPSNGLWATIFGDDEASSLEIAPGDYVIELFRKSKTETQIQFSNNNLEALPETDMDKIYPQFSERMSEDLN